MSELEYLEPIYRQTAAQLYRLKYGFEINHDFDFLSGEHFSYKEVYLEAVKIVKRVNGFISDISDNDDKLPIDSLKEKLAKDLIRCQGWQVSENVDFFKSNHPRAKEALMLAEGAISSLDEFLLDNYGTSIYSLLDDPN